MQSGRSSRRWFGLPWLLLAAACGQSAGKPGAEGGGRTGADGHVTPGLSDLPAGLVGVHRLNNREYDRTVRVLLGVPASAARTFLPDEQSLGFDNIADSLGMTPTQIDQYYQSAVDLAEAVFASPDLRARIMICSPEADAACLRTILETFGLRAWRRPLRSAEIDGLLAQGTLAREAGETADGVVRHLVTTMLTAVPFLYRVQEEPGDKPANTQRLDGYQLAARLSYTLWGSMPDAELFEAARDGSLIADETLARHIDRMLDDPQSSGFTDSFAGQWLGFRDLETHQVDSSVFPAWSEDLRAAMITEGGLFFREFLDDSARGLDEFFTTPVHFVDAPLARHYGMTAPSTAATLRIEDAGNDRVGFLGLGTFLTMSSFVHRTSPTKRGVWILDNLLCSEVPAPPGNIPPLDDAAAMNQATATQNVRDRLAAHRENPSCAFCHKLFDPIGLGLENFDGIGAHRSRYANGDPIDSSGQLPDGSEFRGLGELSKILAKGEGFAACVVKKLFVYAHGRAESDGDVTRLDDLAQRWSAQGLPLRALVRDMAIGESFRSRRTQETP